MKPSLQITNTKQEKIKFLAQGNNESIRWGFELRPDTYKADVLPHCAKLSLNKLYQIYYFPKSFSNNMRLLFYMLVHTQ